MNCKNCGFPLEPNSKFCGNCGQPLGADARAAAADEGATELLDQEYNEHRVTPKPEPPTPPQGYAGERSTPPRFAPDPGNMPPQFPPGGPQQGRPPQYAPPGGPTPGRPPQGVPNTMPPGGPQPQGMPPQFMPPGGPRQTRPQGPPPQGMPPQFIPPPVQPAPDKEKRNKKKDQAAAVSAPNGKGPKKKKTGLMIFILILVLLLALTAVGFFVWPKWIDDIRAKHGEETPATDARGNLIDDDEEPADQFVGSWEGTLKFNGVDPAKTTSPLLANLGNDASDAFLMIAADKGEIVFERANIFLDKEVSGDEITLKGKYNDSDAISLTLDYDKDGETPTLTGTGYYEEGSERYTCDVNLAMVEHKNPKLNETEDNYYKHPSETEPEPVETTPESTEAKTEKPTEKPTEPATEPTTKATQLELTPDFLYDSVWVTENYVDKNKKIVRSYLFNEDGTIHIEDWKRESDDAELFDIRPDGVTGWEWQSDNAGTYKFDHKKASLEIDAGKHPGNLTIDLKTEDRIILRSTESNWAIILLRSVAD
mgnify:CR=1 FL=1